MGKIQILDCTLRDGGYCNQWQFGFENTKEIINSLVEAEADIIECGFLTNAVMYERGITKFNTVQQVTSFIPDNRHGKIFVCLVNYGEYRLEDLPPYDGTSIDGLRVAFHKKDSTEALKFCRGISEKGYKVFVQPMVSLSYSDQEFLDMIKNCNDVNPYAVYIVDSFGVMKQKDLTRLFYTVENNLKENIYIGYHSHNNMQLAYSNAQALTMLQTRRDLIIDCCIFGMGRGAGNLNTELFVEYLNDTMGSTYEIQPLLNIIDKILNKFYQNNYWGYSLANYLSAIHNTHPNYASYLTEKQTLTIEDMHKIFSMMEDEKRISFDKQYMEELYIRYMASEKAYEEHLIDLKDKLNGKKVLLIAPGKSAEEEKDSIISAMDKTDIVTISINFDYPFAETDFIFLSNLRRYRELETEKLSKCIVTSNIPADGVYLQTKYAELLNDMETVRDNAGLMFIKYMIQLNVKELLIAGMDGYSHEKEDNYALDNMQIITKNAILDAYNKGITKVLNEFSKSIKISFITTPKYIVLE